MDIALCSKYVNPSITLLRTRAEANVGARIGIAKVGMRQVMLN